MRAKFTKILREILSEPNNGGLSWGRVASSVALVASLIWITKILIFTGNLPSMDGITAYVVGPYTANKATTAVQSFAGVKETEKTL